MSRPSEKASQLAEELLDYVHPGMNRAAAIEEVAAMVDEMNSELLGVIEALLAEAENIGAGQHAVLINHLGEILKNYHPLQFDPESQHELFAASTSTQTGRPTAMARKA